MMFVLIYVHMKEANLKKLYYVAIVLSVWYLYA